MAEQKIAPVLSDDERMQMWQPYRSFPVGWINGYASDIEQAVLARFGTVRDQALEDAAAVVDAGQETFTNTHDESEGSLSPRRHGNLTGVAYAQAIRALKGSPSPSRTDHAVVDLRPHLEWALRRIKVILSQGDHYDAARAALDAAQSMPADEVARPASQALMFDHWWNAGGRKLVDEAGDKRGWKGAAEAGYIGGSLATGSVALADAQLVPTGWLDAIENLQGYSPIAGGRWGGCMQEGGQYLKRSDAIKALMARDVGQLSRTAGQFAALRLAEAALADIGDATREAGDDVAWCECRAAQALPVVRAAISAVETSGNAGELSDATSDVLAERQRQIAREGYTHDHDDEHVNDEIAALACFYAMPPGARHWDASSTGYGATLGDAILPPDWHTSTGNRRRELVKAGALIIAELERLDRAAIAASKENGNG